MILDNEEQRKLLLAMMEAVNFSGKDLEQAYTLKQAIVIASLPKVDKVDGKGTKDGRPS